MGQLLEGSVTEYDRPRVGNVCGSGEEGVATLNRQGGNRFKSVAFEGDHGEIVSRNDDGRQLLASAQMIQLLLV